MKRCYIDFEFNDVLKSPVNLVSCVTEDSSGKIKTWWLYHDKKSQKDLADYLKTFDCFIAYSAVAECRSFIALGLNPLDFKWVDLFLEYRMMTNHNDKLCYGSQLVEGVVVQTKKPKPKWERLEGDDETGFRPTHSLAEATYKLTGEIRDTEHKTKMRDLIISKPQIFKDEEIKAILEYGIEDVKFLKRIEYQIYEEFKEMVHFETPRNLYLDSERYWRGRYSAHTAIMEERGYRINLEKMKNFSSSVLSIIYDTQREINQLFPDVKPFYWNKKDQRFSTDKGAIEDWVVGWLEENPNATWMETDKGAMSQKLEAFEKYFPFKHDYPKDNFGAQIVRFLKLKQSLNGFVPAADSTRKTFWDFVSGEYVRPYLNHYGAQSSRTQPSATGFLFLKPAWMRAGCEPPKGYAYGGIDYSSQEFLIAALMSGDMNMINAYRSGDVYLAFAKDAGMVPKDATKSSHKFERDLCKATVLGISYQMSKFGLAIKLTNDSGRKFTEDEAQNLINLFYDAYPEWASWQKDIISNYADEGYIKLLDGWYMWGHNPNARSVSNVPVQGLGAAIMRKAVDLAVSRGCEIIFTLHDAIYIQYRIGDESKMNILAEAMVEAFQFYFEGTVKEAAKAIRLDPFVWSPEYKSNSSVEIKGLGEVYATDIYIDERATEEYEKFSKYFEKREEFEL